MKERPPRRQLRINRNLVGLLSLGCVIIAVVLFVRSGGYDRVAASFANVGALLWATWLVIPRDGKLPAWMTPSPWKLLGTLLLVFLFLRRPLVMLPLIGSLVMGAMFLRLKK